MKMNKKNEIIFITRNELKFRTAANILDKYGVRLIQRKIETPEIQSSDGMEVARFSAKHLASELKSAVVKTDVSYEIPALNNFPGPFVKFINKWLTAEDILALMKGKKNRQINIIEYLVYVDKNGGIHTFKTVSQCSLTLTVKEPFKGSAFDKIIIREGYKVPQNRLSRPELDEMFLKQVTIWIKNEKK
jgi:non-canonical purine NTP pyrophosphatase (RdgB/HAM1 family)